MKLKFLSRNILPTRIVMQACYALCLSTAALVMIIGIRRLAELELTEAQVYFGGFSVMTMAGVFLILGALFRNRAGEPIPLLQDRDRA